MENNFLKNQVEEKKPDFLYVVKVQNALDASKVYDIFCNKGYYCQIKDDKENIIVEIWANKKIDDVYDVTKKVNVEYIKPYSFVEDLSGFESSKVNNEERQSLLGRLFRVVPKKKNNKSIAIMLLVDIALLVCFFIFNDLRIMYGAICFSSLMLCVIGFLNSKTRRAKQLKQIAEENWYLCPCEAICIDEVSHYGKDGFVEKRFRLAYRDLCTRQEFSCASQDACNEVKVYLKDDKREFDFTNGYEEIYSFNDKYVIIPNSWVVPEKIKAMFIQEKTKVEVEEIVEPERKEVKAEVDLVIPLKDPVELSDIEEMLKAEEFDLSGEPTQVENIKPLEDIEIVEIPKPKRLPRKQKKKEKKERQIKEVDPDEVVKAIQKIIEEENSENKTNNTQEVKTGNEENPQNKEVKPKKKKWFWQKEKKS